MTWIRRDAAARLLIGAHLKEKAGWVHDSLVDARYLGLLLGEETVTETVLLDLRRSLGVHLRVEPFTRHEESRESGADWQWWFCDGVGREMFGMRVQAKKLKMKSGVPGYDFAYRPRSAELRQVDKLMQAAGTDGIPAVYALYNGPELDLSLFNWGCCTEVPSKQTFGVSLLAASAAKRFADAGDSSLKSVGGLARPWSCSALCKKELRLDVAQKFWPDDNGQLSLYAADLVTDLLAIDAEDQDASPRQRALEAARGYRTWEEAPAYIRNLVAEGGSLREGGDTSVPQSDSPQNLAGVVLVVAADPDDDPDDLVYIEDDDEREFE